MPWPTYSEVLHRGGSENVWTYYTVPVGRRAVMKSICAVNAAAAANRADVSAGGYVVWIHTFPAAIGAVTEALMLVVYGGQSIGIRTTTSNASVVISGYLFSDPTRATGPPASTYAGEVADPEPALAVLEA